MTCRATCWVKFFRNLNYIKISIGTFNKSVILLLSNDAPSFQSNSLMNFLDILVGWTWGCEIFGLVNSSVNQFTPIFPHFLFIDQPQIFTHKFRINSDNFNVLIPQSEYLSWNDVYILQDLIGKFVWVESIWSSHC